MQLPYQPSFMAQLRNNSAVNNGIIAFNYVHLNTGNCYNSSNGRFTAPVAGKYLFNINFTSSAGTTSGPWIKILINGTFTQYGSAYVADGQSETRISNTVIYNLNANDYVQVDVNSGHRGVRGNPDYHNNFSGHLIG